MDFLKNVLLLGAYTAASSIGLLLLKGSLTRVRASGHMFTLSTDVILLGVGLLLYVLSFGLWVGVLARMPLSTAYPLAIGLTLAITTTGAWLLLGERLGVLKLAGILLICAGCAAVNLGDR
jgi:multidrug transporter EmrE-like cation transporter